MFPDKASSTGGLNGQVLVLAPADQPSQISVQPPDALAVDVDAMAAVEVLDEVGVALRENLHHPAIKIVDRVIHDGFEPPVIFSVSFLNVIPQPNADILVLSAETHLLRSQHLNILHRNFGHPIRAAVQLLLFGR